MQGTRKLPRHFVITRAGGMIAEWSWIWSPSQQGYLNSFPSPSDLQRNAMHTKLLHIVRCTGLSTIPEHKLHWKSSSRTKLMFDGGLTLDRSCVVGKKLAGAILCVWVKVDVTLLCAGCPVWCFFGLPPVAATEKCWQTPHWPSGKCCVQEKITTCGVYCLPSLLPGCASWHYSFHGKRTVGVHLVNHLIASPNACESSSHLFWQL